MSSRIRCVLVPLAIFVLQAAPASADDCGPLKQIASIDLAITGSGGRMLVPVTINGVAKQMVLSTAGGSTSLTPAAVGALNLKSIEGNVKLLGGNGYASNRSVRLDSFQVGTILGKDVEMMVSPGPDNGATPSDAPNNEAGNVVGNIAGDLLNHYDVEIDFAHRKVNFFSTDHCAGKVIYWQADPNAVAVVPFSTNRQLHKDPLVRNGNRSFDTHIHVPVTIDGKDFLADINTSAPNSTMSAQTAKFVFDVTADSPGAVPLRGAAADFGQKPFGYVFKSLAFEGIAVNNPHVVVRPDLVGTKDPNNSLVGGSHIAYIDDGMGSEVTVGMDVLRHLRLYIAYGERKLYVTPAAAPDTPAAKP